MRRGLEETTRTPLYYVDEDYPAGPEIQQPLREWSNWRGSDPSALETDVYIWCYTLLVVLARNEWMTIIISTISEHLCFTLQPLLVGASPCVVY